MQEETKPPPPGKQRRRLGQSLREPLESPIASPPVASHPAPPLAAAVTVGAPPTGLRRSGRERPVNPIARPAVPLPRPGNANLVGWIVALIALPIAAAALLVVPTGLGPVILPPPRGHELHAVDLVLLAVLAIGWFTCAGLARDRWRRRRRCRAMTIPLG